MDLSQIKTTDAPAAIGPYSQGIVSGGFLFTAGQIALDPVTGNVIEGDVAAQSERVMQNLAGVLRAAGVHWGHVVKTTVYITDMANFAKVNEIYAKHFGDARPARSTVQVAGLPRNVLVEIDVIARVP